MSKESEYLAKWSGEAAKQKFKAMTVRERIATANERIELEHRMAANADRAKQSMRSYAQSRSEAAE